MLSKIPFINKIPLKIIKYLVVVTFFVVLAYFPIGMIIAHNISDDVEFSVDEGFFVEGGSNAVSMTVSLIDREINKNSWVANNPWFMPSSYIDNMPNFQNGIVYAASRFVIEMGDQIGRTRGSSQIDEDLNEAVSRIKYSGDIWVWQPSVSILPQMPSESQYNQAIKHLEGYNQRLANGEAVFDKRADNLLQTLERISGDLGSSSASIDGHRHNGFFDTKADDIFYQTKGRMYAYYLILKSLGEDFQDVLEEKNAVKVWDEALVSMRKAAELRPTVVTAGTPDAMFIANHLNTIGFYLLRSRTQLKEVSSILAK